MEALHEIEYIRWKTLEKFNYQVSWNDQYMYREGSKDSVHYLYLTTMLISVLGIVKITIKRKLNDD
jgi:hypothetical protein